jgi:dolichol-phosphate mannosyltransferase
MQAIVVVPTYNEQQNLRTLVQQIYANAPDIHILIVDDNSPDGTGLVADGLSEEYPGRLFVLHRNAKTGLGRAYVEGFRYALDAGYEIILQMDGDLSHHPSYIPAFLHQIASNDVVIGSRYRNGVNVINWGFERLLLSKAATAYVRLVTQMPVTDATGGFKCWRRAALEKIDLNSLYSNGYLFQVETTYKAYLASMKIDEITITFYERKGGCSKMNWPIVWEAIWGVLRMRLLPVSWVRHKGRIKVGRPAPAGGQQT